MNQLQRILNELRLGNLQIAYQNIGLLNQYAGMFYNKAKAGDNLVPEQIEQLSILLRICNMLYNSSDMNPLPVEDGVYDIILEYYKHYNPHFQVGGEVVHFASTERQVINTTEKVNPFIDFTEDEVKKMENGFFYNDLKVNPQMTWIDIDRKDSPVSKELISKRSHTVEHNHPRLVGTLDKSKFVLMMDAEEKGVANDSNVKVLERDFFADHIRRGIIRPDQQLEMMLELKYDGISIEADCADRVISARSRGDTGVGVASDMTPILAGYDFPRAREITEDIGVVGVKFEAIMTHGDLARFNAIRGTEYKNCRTAIVGLFGSSDAPLFRDFITLVPLEIDRDDVPTSMWNRENEIEFLNRFFSTKGCPLRHAKIHGDYKTCLYLIKAFLEEAEVARSYLDFMFDGIVVSYIDEDIRAKLGRENFINKYSMAVKFNPLVRQTRFNGYSYTIGQDGTITPMIHYNPVEFFGTIHDKSTGNSFARFKDLDLAEGDIINVEYVNDVMPRVTKYDCEPNRQNPNPKIQFIQNCPACGTPLVFSVSSAKCPNLDCPGRELPRMVNMLNKLGIKGYAEASISALNCHSLTDLYALDDNTAIKILGENGRKLMEALRVLINVPTPEYMIIGALGFTGIAQGSWEAIMRQYTLEELFEAYDNHRLSNLLATVPGIGIKSTETIIAEFPRFMKDLKFINSIPCFISTKGLASPTGPSVRFTGISRDKAFIDYLCANGYDAKDGSVSGNTDILCVPYEGFSSSKVSKAKNARIVTQEQFMKETGYIKG